MSGTRRLAHLVSFLALLTAALGGCARSSRSIQRPAHAEPAAPAQPVEYELQTLDYTGATTRELYTGRMYVSVGLAAPRRGDAPTQVVAVRDGRLVPLLTVPSEFAGVPRHLKRFDVAFEPQAVPAEAEPASFSVVASSYDARTSLTYHARWTFTWNPRRETFEVGAPKVASEAPGPCLVCNGAPS